MKMQAVRAVQEKILETMKFIDKLCREHGIVYYIMGGTALGAVRHGGFIPWDDDLDIFMTPDQYQKFKLVFEKVNSQQFVIQEWRTDSKYLEYAKVRMNGTTFIEEHFKDRKNMHHGIYVDIMILHKVPENKFVQKLVYLESKFVTLYGLSQRKWVPKSKSQAMVLKSLIVFGGIGIITILSMVVLSIKRSWGNPVSWLMVMSACLVFVKLMFSSSYVFEPYFYMLI